METEKLRKGIRLGEINTDTPDNRAYWEWTVRRIYDVERQADCLDELEQSKELWLY